MRKGGGGTKQKVIRAQAGIHLSGGGAVGGWVPAFAGMTDVFYSGLRESTAASVLKGFFFFLAAIFVSSSAHAICGGPVADGGVRLWRAAVEAEKAVAITFLGHASFLIESPEGVR